MSNDGECIWKDTDTVRWLNTDAAVWASPHAIFVDVTDGVVWGEDTGPFDLGLSISDGAKFGESLNVDYGLSLNDGIVFGESQLYTQYGLSLTDGTLFGDNPGPYGLGLALTDGVKFGESTIWAWLLSVSDGIVFGDTPNVGYGLSLSDGAVFGDVLNMTYGLTLTDGTLFSGRILWYDRQTGEHDIFAKAFLMQYDYSALKRLISPNDTAASLPLLMNNPSIPMLSEWDARPVEFAYRALEITQGFIVKPITFDYKARNKLYKTTGE